MVFIDDDDLVLRSMKRLLRGYGQGWDLTFTTDARRALAILDQKPVDVIVSDLRMSVTGATVLAQAQSAHPDVARIVVSGHTSLPLAIRCIPLAHQFFSKPFDPPRFTAALERICALRRVVGNSVIRTIVGGNNGLPAAPSAHADLVAALRRSQPNAAEIATIAERDIGISTRLLQLANSTLFGPPLGVFTVHAAIASLGIDTVRTLILSSDMVRPLHPKGTMSGFSLAALGEHALRTARLARQIAGADGDHAFIAGLLHKVGQLVLAARLPHRFGEALDKARASNSGLLRVERDLLGLTHAEVGAYLLGLWGFRRSAIEAVAHHARPEQVGPTWGVAGAVHVASILAADPDAPLGDEPEEDMTRVPAGYLERLGLGAELPKWRELAVELR